MTELQWWMENVQDPWISLTHSDGILGEERDGKGGVMAWDSCGIVVVSQEERKR